MLPQGRRTNNCSIKTALNELYWLKIGETCFQNTLVVFQCLIGLFSNELETLPMKLPNRCQSQNMSLLETKWTNKKFGKQTFSYAGPKLLNTLPSNTQILKDLTRFNKDIQTQGDMQPLNKYRLAETQS